MLTLLPRAHPGAGLSALGETDMTTTQTEGIDTRITLTSYAGHAWARYTPDSEARVYFSASWRDIVRAEQAPLTADAHPFAVATAVGLVANDRPSLATHITIEQLPLVVTLDGAAGRAADRAAILAEWVKFCDEAIESAAYDCDCDEADLTIEEIDIGMRRSWRADPSDIPAHTLASISGHALA